ncbi:glycosyltransferase family protein [Cohnella thailandensis]|uniref:Glycosyltransferase family 4 protein n=1 Tax=Cohnella thailandensis TaxID=557557 RepID=A0A841T1V9_9BACL|nr:glycosyltransferase [Cohnella thailandensis]MBB6635867.1 glycosyltransferase family 4 protein [Cohnella thailandensis]MBP1976245.1 glycosyltransferase involved in cell wall biosynthesis [Cohnella thailandensis]
MRVLHLPVGRQMIEMCSALRQIGVDATSCHFRERSVPLKPDLCLHLERLNGEERKKRREEFLEEAIERYDVFHFHFGETFFKDRSDLAILKKHGKKLVVQHRGSDVRMLSVARTAGNPHVRVKEGERREERQIRRKLKILSAYIDHAIVADHELRSYIRGFYKKIHMLRQFVTLNKFEPSYPSERNRKPLIVHAPTNPYLKGTEYVQSAIDRLSRKGTPFEYRQIERMTHKEAIRCYREADIIIDQLLQGSFGVFSLEGMALGKPVVCHIRDDLRKTYPPGLPIVSADPDTCYDTLKRLVRNPKARRRIGMESRVYVEKYYDSRKLAEELKQIYLKLS